MATFTRLSSAWYVAPLLTVVVAMSLAGCGDKSTSGTAVPEGGGPSGAGTNTAQASGADTECQTTSAPLLQIPPHADGEPKVSIPKPSGWQRDTSQDSDIIRLVLVNHKLVNNGFAPTAVVTLESVPGSVPPDNVFDSNRNTLVASGGATDLRTTASTVCGQPAERVEYTCAALGRVPARPCRLLNVVTSGNGHTFLMTVTLQSTDPDNPTYRQDADEILNGFQVTPPA